MLPTHDLKGKDLAGRFEVLEQVGGGGMGLVYKARQKALDRTVAVKTMMASEFGGDERVERFLREASVCAKMTHSNTVRVFDFGREDDGLCWLAMEFLEGRSLAQVLERDGALGVARAVHIAEQMALALHEAHEHDVVHRDVKPGNIMLVRQGDDTDHVKVVDFGLVKSMHDQTLSPDSRVMGSPQYMSPEQVQNEGVTAASDIYGLGMVLYQMLSGRLAFEGTNLPQLMYAHAHTPPTPFSELEHCQPVPPKLERLVLRCLAKAPADRPKTADDVATSLHRIARSLGGTLALRASQGMPMKYPAPSADHPAPTVPTGLSKDTITTVAVVALVGWFATTIALWLSLS